MALIRRIGAGRGPWSRYWLQGRLFWSLGILVVALVVVIVVPVPTLPSTVFVLR